MDLIVPFWFKQRQCKTEPSGDNAVKVTGPNLGEAHLRVFAEDGRLAERQLVRMPKGEILLREVCTAAGTVRVLDGKGKELLGAIDVGINPGVRPAEGSKALSYIAAGMVTVKSWTPWWVELRTAATTWATSMESASPWRRISTPSSSSFMLLPWSQ